MCSVVVRSVTTVGLSLHHRASPLRKAATAANYERANRGVCIRFRNATADPTSKTLTRFDALP
jgi:hypothetical protein